jgi:uncharacterized protein involved in exopolysaccharide biosynthesis
MNHRDETRPSDADELDLRELTGALWRGRWIILSVTAVMTLIATIAAFTVPKRYQASIVVLPVAIDLAGNAAGGMGPLTSQLGGLAALAGITVGGDSGKVESVAVLRSDTLIERYIDERNLLPVLFAPAWDAEAKRWKTDDPEKMPTLWKGTQFFKKKVRRVAEDKKNGLFTMTVTWKDPGVAAAWANDLVRMTNEYLRDKKIHDSERHIAYLKAEAMKTDVVPVRSAIHTVLESEIKAVMLARGNEEYALKVVDRAVAPEVAAFPQPKLWILGGLFLGLVISAVFVLVRRAWTETARD